MKPFNMKLSEEDRAKLELHRARLGLRSHVEVVRYWIAQPLGGDGPPQRYGVTPQPTLAQSVYVGAPNQASALNQINANVAKDLGDPLGVQYGPIRAKPGDRLKKGILYLPYPRLAVGSHD